MRCLAYKRFLIHGLKKQQQTKTRKKSRQLQRIAASLTVPPGDRQHDADARHARSPFTLVRGASRKCFDPPPSLCVIVRPCACVRGSASATRAEENAMEWGGWGVGGELMAGIFKNKTKKAEAKCWIPPKKCWMFLLTPRVARRRRVSRRSRRWVRRPRTAAVGWPISLCPWLQGTSTLEVFFFPLSYLYIFFLVSIVSKLQHQLHIPPPPQQGDYFFIFLYFFFSQHFT